jgi:hypothetical protein
MHIPDNFKKQELVRFCNMKRLINKYNASPEDKRANYRSPLTQQYIKQYLNNLFIGELSLMSKWSHVFKKRNFPKWRDLEKTINNTFRDECQQTGAGLTPMYLKRNNHEETYRNFLAHAVLVHFLNAHV